MQREPSSRESALELAERVSLADRAKTIDSPCLDLQADVCNDGRGDDADRSRLRLITAH